MRPCFASLVSTDGSAGPLFASSDMTFCLDRLHTVIDFDRVLVLAQGEVLEYDTPSALLAKPDSEFARLCQETGDFDQLRKMADAHASRQ